MRLPGVVQEIADVIGRERALYLVGQLPRCYAGTAGHKSWRVIMYVPKTLKADHQLVHLLGWHDARRLVDAFGGEILQPPTCAEIYRKFRDASIIRMARSGMKSTAIADLMEVSERHVRNLLREEIPQEGIIPANDNTARVSERRAG